MDDNKNEIHQINEVIEEAKSLSANGQIKDAKDILLKLYTLNSSNVRVLEGLAKLSIKMQDFEEAYNWYQILLTIKQNSRIYKRVGHLLANYLNDYQTAELMYQKALSTDPLGDELLFYYAQLLAKNMKNTNEARKKYKESIDIKPTAYKHAKFGYFLMDIDEHNEAKHHFQKAMELDPNNEEYSDTFNHLQSMYQHKEEEKLQTLAFDETNYKNIKFVVINFNILVFNKKYSIDCNIRDQDIVVLFGGKDRIIELDKLFSNLMSIGITILFFSNELHQKIIFEIIQRCAGFGEYFIDHIERNIVDRIECITQLHSSSNRGNTVYIDCILSRAASKYCQILPLPKNKFLPGLKLIDIQKINNIFRVQSSAFCVYDAPFPFDVPSSMINENSIIYNAIKMEIDTPYSRRTRSYPSVKSLPVYNHINNERKNWLFSKCFVEFIWKWHDIKCAANNRDNWTAANLLFQLVQMEENDHEIYAELGKAFSYLKCDDFAHHFYSKAIAINPSSYTTHKSFAIHLCRIKSWDEALDHFCFCIESKENESDMRRSFVPSIIAQAFDHAENGNDDEAEVYYKLAIENQKKERRQNPDGTARLYQNYGTFLSKKERYNESLEQFNKALDIHPRNEWVLWKMAKIYFETGNKEKEGECLKSALEINPDHIRAKRDYFRCFGHEYQTEYDQHVQQQHNNDDNECKQSEECTNFDETISNELRSFDLYHHTKQNQEYQQQQQEEEKTNSAPTYNQSAQSTALSAYHPANENEKKFIKVYRNKFKESEDWEQYKQYLMEMHLKGLNDMQTVIKHDLETLREYFEDECNINNKQHLEQIVNLFGSIKEKHLLFRSALEINGINEKSINKIESAGIFCMDDLAKRIDSIKDVYDLLSVTTGDEMEKMSDNILETTHGYDDDDNNNVNIAQQIYNLVQSLGDND